MAHAQPVPLRLARRGCANQGKTRRRLGLPLKWPSEARSHRAGTLPPGYDIDLAKLRYDLFRLMSFAWHPLSSSRIHALGWTTSLGEDHYLLGAHACAVRDNRRQAYLDDFVLRDNSRKAKGTARIASRVI